ncbi:MAG: glycosyltransferase family 4 protein [Anaerolineae bacterium]|nr:glycosyltransferase family 4 protein [Anaerolineae bacterium]MEB2366429.1 glycosyltransferase family 4 protein [Chloroflexota bacterium]
MRIWLVTQYYPPEVGAAPVRLSRLARMLVALGHEVSVLTAMPNYPDGVINPPYRGRFAYAETIDGVTVRRVWLYTSPSKRARARIANQLSFMLTLAARGTFLKRPDVMLVESHPLFVTIATGWLRRIKRAPVVLNVSDLWPESAVATGMLKADSLFVKAASRVERWAYNDAAHIIGMTQGVVDGILKVHSRKDRVSMIANAVDLEAFKPASAEQRLAARAALGLPMDRFTAVHVGNMSLTYDFEVILAAAAALPDVIFAFAGGGSQAGHLAEQVTVRKLDNVKLLGLLPHSKVPDVWAAGDISMISLADSSLADGTRPAKMYEAFAAGVPVVAAIRGEGAALLTEAGGGIAVPVGGHDEFVTAIRSLHADPSARERMSQAGRSYAVAHLSPDAVTSRYLTILEQVMPS